MSEHKKCPQEVDFSCSIKSTCSAVNLQKVKIRCKLSSLLPRLKKQNSPPEGRVAMGTGTCLPPGTEPFNGAAEIHWTVSWVGFHLQPARMWLFISQRLSSLWQLFELWKTAAPERAQAKPLDLLTEEVWGQAQELPLQPDVFSGLTCSVEKAPRSNASSFEFAGDLISISKRNDSCFVPSLQLNTMALCSADVQEGR